MIRAMQLRELVEPLAATLVGDNVTFVRVNTDTRALEEGDLFLALKGARFDGHNFLPRAWEEGAVALVVEQLRKDIALPQLQVANTTRALGEIARLSRQLFEGPLIGLTGSSGKTTVKEMLASIFSGAGRVHVTRGNLNNHIGVPQTLLAMPPGTDYAVIEMGASGPAEIAYLASLAEPTVALVNNVMAAHLEGFGSLAGVAAEKSRIYFGLRPGGTAVINLDEPFAADWLQELQSQRADVRIVTFALSRDEARVRASAVHLNEQGFYQFLLHADDRSVSVQLAVLGRHNVHNALAAASCAWALGLDLDLIAAGLAAVKPVSGRMAPVAGVHQSLVIDDTYNANPGSVKAAAAVLADYREAGRDTLLVLGDLGELGADEVGLLQQLGRDLQTLGLQRLLTCGRNSRLIGEGFARAVESNNVQQAFPEQQTQHFHEQEALGAFLLNQLTNNTVVLVKGSRSARMEYVVQAITLSGDYE